MFNFNESAQRASKEYGLGGDFLRLEKGETKIRLLDCAPEPTVKHFINNKPVDCPGPKTCQNHSERPSVKYKTYILNRTDGEIKTYDMPLSVFKAIGSLQMDEDYRFDGLPMPYDVKIKFDPDASPAEMYKTVPSPKQEPLSEQVLAELGKKTPLNVKTKFVKEGDLEIPIIDPIDDGEPARDENMPF